MYGIDIEDHDLMRARTWRWLLTRIIGLLSDPDTRTSNANRPARTDHTQG